MAQSPILINLDKKTFEELHDLMGMKLIVDEITVYRMYEGKSKQQFYREVLRAGMRAKLFAFEKKKKEIEIESQDSD